MAISIAWASFLHGPNYKPDLEVEPDLEDEPDLEYKPDLEVDEGYWREALG